MSAMQHWKRLWPKHILVLFFVVISPAAFLIPNDVFSQYPWTRTYAEWLAKGIPMIDRAAHMHPHPEKFKVFFAYAWSLLPFALFWTISVRHPLQATLQKIRQESPFVFVLLGLVSVGTLWMLIFAPGPVIFDLDLLPRRNTRAHLYATDFTIAWSAPMHVLCASAAALAAWCVASIFGDEVNSIKTPGQDQ